MADRFFSASSLKLLGFDEVLVVKIMIPTASIIVSAEFIRLLCFIRELAAVINAPIIVAAVIGNRGKKNIPTKLYK